MLTSIRTTFSKGIARWVLIFLMSILILSFGIWGIQDVFRGFGSTDVVSIGDTKISMDAVQRAFNQQVQQLSRRVGKPLTPTEARMLGVDKQVLSRLTTSAALDEQAKSYGLGLSHDKIAQVLLDDPAFKDPSGRFDRNYFNAILRENGMSEGAFFAEQQRVYLRGQIGEALAGEITLPKTMQEALARYANETRSVSYVTLTDQTLGTVAPPDDAALRAFYDERKGEFRAPEFRKFTYIAVTPDDLAAKATVTDDDARADYDARKDKYTTPEKRTIQQIAFPNAADAKAAADRIKSGQSTFDAVAAERKVAPGDLELGTVARKDLLDPAIADAAFKLSEGSVSDVVQGGLSTVILRVTKVEPEIVVPFDTAKEQIKKDLALDRARRDLTDLQAKVEDERAGGAPLKEIAGKLGLKASEIVAMDAQGRDAAGQPYNLPQQAKLTSAVFTNDPGSDTDVIDGRESGLIWFSVDDVTQARDRTFEEAKADVTAAWTDQEKAKRLQAKADDLIKALQAGKTLDDVAKELGVEVQQAWNLKRNSDGQGLSAAAVNQVFATPVKGFATALSGNGDERIVFQLNESLVPPFDPKAEAAVALERQMGQLVQQDLLSQYVGRLQSDLGLTINQTNLNRAIGGGES